VSPIPFEIREKITGVYRCEFCGKLINANPLIYKTCCMNKPVILCSKECLMKWLAEWGKNQEQLTRSRTADRRSPLRKLTL